MALSKYMQPRTIRPFNRTKSGRFRGGKLVPVMAEVFRESEGGLVTQTLNFELDPIAGRMITPIEMEVTAVFVPALALDAEKNPEGQYPGNAEIFREKLLSETPVFGHEPEGEISRRCGINPRSVGGVKKVNEAIRLSYVAATNYLRRLKYVNAAQLPNTTAIVTPALIGQTVLDRLGGVLNPEDRVNGRVQLGLSETDAPVQGIGYNAANANSSQGSNVTVKETGGQVMRDRTRWHEAIQIHTDANANPKIFADLSSIEAGGMSLTDLFQAERIDQLTREMREMVDANPELGEEIVRRYAAGLMVDTGKQPFVVYKKSQIFGMNVQRAMDGPSLGVMNTSTQLSMQYSVPIPVTEFGGVLITLCSLKPDEKIDSQPHPVASDVWTARNYVADELAIDPVPVTIRDVDSDCAVGDEDTVVMYGANNGLLQSYVDYGFTRNTDLTTVENKTAIWQLEIPLSVTPESVIYPDDISHYPFADQTAEVCTYVINSDARIATPIIVGPSPVEELAEIETADVFEDAPET